MSRRTRIFIIGDYYHDINIFLENIKDFINCDFKIYNFVLQSYINKDLDQIKDISNITNGKMILYNIDELPDKLIETYKEAITNYYYITDLNISSSAIVGAALISEPLFFNLILLSQIVNATGLVKSGSSVTI